MRRLRWIRWSAVYLGLTILAHGQQPAPIADPVDQALTPSGISILPVTMNGPRAYSFREPDGTNVIHVLGEFVLTLGEGEAQQLRSSEAIVWINRREHSTRPYQHLEILLWRDAEIIEIGGTRTTGPALFVTLNTRGPIEAKVDNWSIQPPTDSEPLRQGRAIREGLAARRLPGPPDPTLPRVVDLTTLGEPGKPPAVRPLVRVWSEGELSVTEAPDHRRVLTVTGGVDLARGVPGSDQFLEVHADSVVVFLSPEARSPVREERAPGGDAEREQSLGGIPTEKKPSAEKRSAGDRTDRQMLSAALGELEVEGAYLEGDVVMAQGPNMVRASRLYYDFINDRSIILDAAFRTVIVERNTPLYIRASRIRQLSQTRYAADDAIVTTSEFHTPHYHVGAGHVDLYNLTTADPTGAIGGVRSGAFRIRDATLNVLGTPILYWPFVQGNVDTSETALQSLRIGYSDDFGFEFESNWELFSLLGYRTPDGFDSTLSLDYYSERGPAAGVDLKYERDRYYGLVRSYLMGDHGTDFLGDDRETPSPHDIRGRFLTRHRQYLEDDWQVSLELSYISDSTFLEEFFESEFDNEKEQETLLYLKRQRDNWAFTALLQYRIMDFLTQTERLPDFGLFLTGEPLTDRIVWHSENRAGLVRLRTDEPTLREVLTGVAERIPGSGTVVRGDSRQELELPFDVGPLRIVPFASVRGTAWDDTPEEGGAGRVFGSYGVRGSTYFWRVFPDIRSELFDIDGVRHIIKPQFTAWMAHTNVDSDELYEFDQTVERIDEVDGVTVGVRQRWQTRRGEGDNRASVDVFTLDLETGAFNDNPDEYTTNGFTSFSRPENSIARNYVNSAFIWRVNSRTAILNETNYDIIDKEVDIFNVSVVVERSPRLSYLFGYRLIDESQSELLGFDLNYKLTEKHIVAIRESFDLEEGETAEFTVALIRRFPRWFAAVSFDLDEAEDDFGVSLSVWPEGLPSATLGSRRFAGIDNLARTGGE